MRFLVVGLVIAAVAYTLESVELNAAAEPAHSKLVTPVELGEDAQVNAKAKDPVDDEEESNDAASAEKVTPKPWEQPNAPYHEWAVDADAFPQKVLDEALKPKDPPPAKVFDADVKKYRTGREGDEIGMKIGTKEIHAKTHIMANNGVMTEHVREREQAEKDARTATIVQKEFKAHEGQQKTKIKKAAAEPPKPPVAEEKAEEDSIAQADRDIMRGKTKEIADLNDMANGAGDDVKK